MNKFHKIIDEFYIGTNKTKLIDLLIELKVLDKIEYSINEYFVGIKNKNKNEISLILTLTISDIAIAINGNGIDIKPKETELTQLIIYLIRETFLASNLSSFEYFSILKQTLKIVYKNNDWNFVLLNDLLQFDNLQYFSQKKQKKIKTSKPIYLVWNSKAKIDFFISDVVDLFNGIRNKRNIYKLFDALDTEFQITVKSKHLELFLSLFFILNQCNTITTKGNRGIYKYLEYHIIPPENDNFPNLEFRKIRDNAFSKKKKKEQILNNLKVITNKYCDNGQ